MIFVSNSGLIVPAVVGLVVEVLVEVVPAVT
jgi:hypothetical protein